MPPWEFVLCSKEVVQRTGFLPSASVLSTLEEYACVIFWKRLEAEERKCTDLLAKVKLCLLFHYFLDESFFRYLFRYNWSSITETGSPPTSGQVLSEVQRGVLWELLPLEALRHDVFKSEPLSAIGHVLCKWSLLLTIGAILGSKSQCICNQVKWPPLCGYEEGKAYHHHAAPFIYSWKLNVCPKGRRRRQEML